MNGIGLWVGTKNQKMDLLHYTEGGPWFEKYKDCEYADKWTSIANTLK